MVKALCKSGNPGIWNLNKLFMPHSLHVNIGAPCQQHWQQMLPSGQGRHCRTCEKTVVDFTQMSDEQVIQYLQRANGKVCGRFHNDQLDRPLLTASARRPFPFQFGWSLLISGLLLGSPTFAMPGKDMENTSWVFSTTLAVPDQLLEDTAIRRNDTVASEKIKGVIYQQGDTIPIPYVSVMVKGVAFGANDVFWHPVSVAKGHVLDPPLPGR